MQRYAVEQFDRSTFQVVDLIEKREICVCSDYDDREEAKLRAEKIAALLNASEVRFSRLIGLGRFRTA